MSDESVAGSSQKPIFALTINESDLKELVEEGYTRVPGSSHYEYIGIQVKEDD